MTLPGGGSCVRHYFSQVPKPAELVDTLPAGYTIVETRSPASRCSSGRVLGRRVSTSNLPVNSRTVCPMARLPPRASSQTRSHSTMAARVTIAS